MASRRSKQDGSGHAVEACGTAATAFEALGLGPRLRGGAGNAGGWSTSGGFFSGGLELALLFLQAEPVLASAICGSGAAVEVANGATGGAAGGVPGAATGGATGTAMGGTEASSAPSEAMSAFGLFARRPLCAADASDAAFADCTGSSACELEGLFSSAGAETVPVAACKKCKLKEKTINSGRSGGNSAEYFKNICVCLQSIYKLIFFANVSRHKGIDCVANQKGRVMHAPIAFLDMKVS